MGSTTINLQRSQKIFDASHFVVYFAKKFDVERSVLVQNSLWNQPLMNVPFINVLSRIKITTFFSFEFNIFIKQKYNEAFCGNSLSSWLRY